MLEIVYRPAALSKIDEIAEYTTSRWGQVQAREYLADLRRKIEMLAEFPGMGSRATGLPEPYRKAFSGAHRVIYRTTETELVVVRIIHEREDVPDEFDDFL